MNPKRATVALLLILLAGLAPSAAWAQYAVSRPASAPARVDPSYIMPPGAIYVNPKSFKKPAAGATGPLLSFVTCSEPADRTDCGARLYSGWNKDSQTTQTGQPYGGDVRFLCQTSHIGFDDPIVWPGAPGKTHLHLFFGNTRTSAYSRPEDMILAGDSTCPGGTLNRSGYWVPPLVYHCPAGSTNGCDRSKDGNLYFPDFNQAYYKYDGALSSIMLRASSVGPTRIQFPPNGMRMIAGNANTAASAGNIQGNQRWECNSPNRAKIDYDHLPTQADGRASPFADVNETCNSLNMHVFFPNCWDGVNLDSPDHKSHLSYYPNYTECPAGFPVLIPNIQFNIEYSGLNVADLDYLRLSSDVSLAEAKTHAPGNAGGLPVWACATAARNWCAGVTMHGDWMGGWSRDANAFGPNTPSILDAMMSQCWMPNATTGWGYDCHNSGLGRPDPSNPTRVWSTSDQY